MAPEHDLIVGGRGVGGEEAAGCCAEAGMAILDRIPPSVLLDVVSPYPTFVRGVDDSLRQIDA